MCCVKVTKKQKNHSFLLKYKWWIFLLCFVLLVVYIGIYISFKGNGLLSAGIDLEKEDWLAFLGAYLTFAGTIAVSTVASLQTKYFAEIEKEKANETRKKKLQPIFSVVIEEIDTQVSGTAEIFNRFDPSTYPKHKNVTISIENVSEYPILNVIIFDNYMFQLLKSNDKKAFQIAYSDSPDVQRWKKHMIEIFESEYARTENGIPEWFNICYEDIDGDEWRQTFEIKDFDGKRYYSLEGIYPIE
jgi:L-rhamnose mutarotase